MFTIKEYEFCWLLSELIGSVFFFFLLDVKALGRRAAGWRYAGDLRREIEHGVDDKSETEHPARGHEHT